MIDARTICTSCLLAWGAVWAQTASKDDCVAKLPQLEKTLKSGKAGLTVWNEAAVCNANLGQTDRAIEQFAHITKMQPGVWQAWNNLGAAYLSAGRLENAEQPFRKALRLSPSRLSILSNLAETLIQLKRPAEAFPFLDRAQAADPNDVALTRVWLDQAVALAENSASLITEGKYAEAQKQLIIVKRPLEVSASWQNLLGYAEFKLGHAEPALAHMQKALAMEPDNEDYVIDLAEFLANHEAYERVLDVFDVAAKRMPNSSRMQFGRAVALILQNRRDEATGILEKLAAAQPVFEQAWRALGECYEDAGRTDDLIALGKKLQSIDPKSPYGWYFEGRGMLDRADALSPAAESLKKAVQLEPNSSRSRFHLARALELEGDLDGAVAELQTAIKLDPKHQSAHYVLGRIYQRQGKTELAKAELASHQELKNSDRNAEFRRLLITLR